MAHKCGGRGCPARSSSAAEPARDIQLGSRSGAAWNDASQLLCGAGAQAAGAAQHVAGGKEWLARQREQLFKCGFHCRPRRDRAGSTMILRKRDIAPHGAALAGAHDSTYGREAEF